MRSLHEKLARARTEDGVTLIELVVVCSVMTVILGFVTQTLVTMQNAATGASLRLQNLDEARILTDEVTKDIRTAARMSPTTAPFDVTACTTTGNVQPCAPSGWGTGSTPPYVGNTEMWFYANLTLGVNGQGNPCPDIVHLFVDTTANPPVLREQTVSDVNPTTDTPPTCQYGTTASYTTRLVGKYIVNGVGGPCLTPDPVFVYWYDDATGTPAFFPTTSAPLVATDRIQVNAVGVTFAVRQQTNFHVACATIVNRVRLANVDYNPIPNPNP